MNSASSGVTFNLPKIEGYRAVLMGRSQSKALRDMVLHPKCGICCFYSGGHPFYCELHDQNHAGGCVLSGMGSSFVEYYWTKEERQYGTNSGEGTNQGAH